MSLVLYPQKCNKCDGEWEVWSASPPAESGCPHCEHQYLVSLYQTLASEVKAEIDELIFAREILLGMKKIKQVLQIHLGQSNQLFAWRYEALRALQPDRFTCSGQAYWNGFYS